MAEYELQQASPLPFNSDKTNLPNSGFLEPTDYDDAWRISSLLADSNFVPKQFVGRPQDVMAAIAMGKELGFNTLQSVQNIAVINGRPSIWGDIMRAKILDQPSLIDFKEHFDEETRTAHCYIKRRMRSGIELDFSGTFSETDADAAGLLTKDNYKKHFKRMCQWRAFGYAARDAFADALKGIALAEESQDRTSIKDINVAEADRKKVKEGLEKLIEDKQFTEVLDGEQVHHTDQKRNPKDGQSSQEKTQTSHSDKTINDNCAFQIPEEIENYERNIRSTTDKRGLDEIYQHFTTMNFSKGEKEYLLKAFNKQAEFLKQHQ